ncbi:hypothetical protein SAMN05428995_103467 [Loktanella sp. DSM 29012]|uniref:hypothetical protein n=1 Tax=Loktanella sp. DSM 29012 TaxID=1881056 RepID=UPI0008B995C6|nr:hypothetical protein [Loktanella sp. DSM 29012]SEQ28798.1 hypothetical protein SAMN05428995_103467 [Loktanella sp. DSM 29012]
MPRIVTAATCLGLSALLSACGGGGGVTVDRDFVVGKADQFEVLSDRLDTIAPTQFTAMPTSGSASFKGAGGFFVENNVNRTSDDLTIVGDADITANFSRGTVTGDVTNLFGVVGANPRTGRFFDVDGDIQLGRRGSSIGRGAPNNFATTYDGTLRTDSDGTFVLRGTVDGKFGGTIPSAAKTPDTIRAIAGVDEDAGITRNGRAIDAEFLVFGEN